MICLITPTGARQTQISLCVNMMKDQTYKGDVVWVIVDDCIPVTSDIVVPYFKNNWTVLHEYPDPPWRTGFNTQGRNLSVGINRVMQDYKDIEAIFIIEDDDYYRPTYLEKMMERMEGYNVIGEMNTIYYNVYFRTHVINPNTKHASLFQIAFTPEVVPIFKQCYTERFIDAKFFQLMRGEGVNLFKSNDLAIGIKGLPGRAGIGAGHGKGMNMRQDPQLKYLTSLIGNDANIYSKYYGGCCN